MALGLRTPVPVPEDSGLILSMVHSCLYFLSGGSTDLFWPPWVLGMYMVQSYTGYSHKVKLKKKTPHILIILSLFERQ